jgi:hypothetical protein
LCEIKCVDKSNAIFFFSRLANLPINKIVSRKSFISK